MDDAIERDSTPKRNPLTTGKHRRETWWQITLPLLVGVLVVVALSVAANYGSRGDVNRWAQVSIIWLVVPMIFFSVLFLVALIGIIYVLARVMGILPPYAFKAQNLFTRIDGQSKRVADAAVEPVMRAGSFRAGLRALWRR